MIANRNLVVLCWVGLGQVRSINDDNLMSTILMLIIVMLIIVMSIIVMSTF
jgi:hypothetical protein